MDIKILIATHKKYNMPMEECYLPIQVGSEGKQEIGYQKDNVGNHISYKNPYYCELTGLYWGVKNLECEYIGLVHYRRHFAVRGIKKYIDKNNFNYVLNKKEIQKHLEVADVLLPYKRYYFIETLYTHYANTHYAYHLDETRDIISSLCPEYLKAFDKVMKQRSGHMFNMFIMKKEKADQYCNWLFSILEKLEDRINIEEYDVFQARLYGRVSELLLNVWIEKNQIKYQEIPYLHMEKINWFNKVYLFLKAKMFGKKFNKSF